MELYVSLRGAAGGAVTACCFEEQHPVLRWQEALGPWGRLLSTCPSSPHSTAHPPSRALCCGPRQLPQLIPCSGSPRPPWSQCLKGSSCHLRQHPEDPSEPETCIGASVLGVPILGDRAPSQPPPLAEAEPAGGQGHISSLWPSGWCTWPLGSVLSAPSAQDVWPQCMCVHIFMHQGCREEELRQEMANLPTPTEDSSSPGRGLVHGGPEAAIAPPPQDLSPTQPSLLGSILEWDPCPALSCLPWVL